VLLYKLAGTKQLVALAIHTPEFCLVFLRNVFAMQFIHFSELKFMILVIEKIKIKDKNER